MIWQQSRKKRLERIKAELREIRQQAAYEMDRAFLNGLTLGLFDRVCANPHLQNIFSPLTKPTIVGYTKTMSDPYREQIEINLAACHARRARIDQAIVEAEYQLARARGAAVKLAEEVEEWQKQLDTVESAPPSWLQEVAGNCYRYYSADSGCVFSHLWTGNKFDIRRLEAGNVYATRAQADWAILRQQSFNPPGGVMKDVPALAILQLGLIITTTGIVSASEFTADDIVACYWIGLWHPTRASAVEWLDKYKAVRRLETCVY